MQAAFTVGKVAAIAVMIAAAFALGVPASDAAASVAAGTRSGTGDVASFVKAVGAGLFAFGGWHMVTYAAGETVDPVRTIPRALVTGIAVVVVAYMALNAAYLYGLPVDAVINSTRVAAHAADAVLGSGGAAFMSALVSFALAQLQRVQGPHQAAALRVHARVPLRWRKPRTGGVAPGRGLCQRQPNHGRQQLSPSDRSISKMKKVPEAAGLSAGERAAISGGNAVRVLGL